MRHLLTPNALKTRNLYKNQPYYDDPDWRDPGQIFPRDPDDCLLTAREVVCDERAPSVEQTGLLDLHGTPLVRHVIPIQRPIGFGQIHPDDDGAEAIVYITTEAEIRVSQLPAGHPDDPYDHLDP